jgi:hypothetical protein
MKLCTFDVRGRVSWIFGVYKSQHNMTVRTWKGIVDIWRVEKPTRYDRSTSIFANYMESYRGNCTRNMVSYRGNCTRNKVDERNQF